MWMLLLAMTGSGTTVITRSKEKLKLQDLPVFFMLGIGGGLECQSGGRRYTTIYIFVFVGPLISVTLRPRLLRL
jgi:hypothetical protein